MRIGLIDYGMGNLHSVQQAFIRFERPLKLIQNSFDLDGCDALILPGVGAFDPAMENLTKTKLIPYLKTWAQEGKPLLGICLGLQLLFEHSDEGSTKGLGLLKGTIQRLPANQGERIPHMGWAVLNRESKCPLLDENNHDNWMYFVHSYAAIPSESSDIAATANFGKSKLTAMIWNGRLGACQFHPEKSGYAGQQMLGRWINWLEDGAKVF